MGGRGATSGIERVNTTPVPANAYSQRMSHQETRDAVSTHANFIFRQLEQDEAIQIIIRRSFRGGEPVIELSGDLLARGLTKDQARGVLRSVESWINRFNNEYKQLSRDAKTSAIVARRQLAVAKQEAVRNARSTLLEAKRRIKKNYRI